MCNTKKSIGTIINAIKANIAKPYLERVADEKDAKFLKEKYRNVARDKRAAEKTNSKAKRQFWDYCLELCNVLVESFATEYTYKEGFPAFKVYANTNKEMNALWKNVVTNSFFKDYESRFRVLLEKKEIIFICDYYSHDYEALFICNLTTIGDDLSDFKRLANVYSENLVSNLKELQQHLSELDPNLNKWAVEKTNDRIGFLNSELEKINALLEKYEIE